MIEAIEPVEYVSAETFEIAGRQFPNHLIFRYDATRWDFRKIIADYFGVSDLEKLHLSSVYDRSVSGKKNSLAVSKALKAAVAEKSNVLLTDMIYNYIAKFLGPIKHHQTVPMLRVNFHGAQSILRFHRDREYGQTPNLINLWLPVTAVWGSNSMYIESQPGLSDFKPVELEYGQAFMFYGTELLHGTMDNDTGSTRITYDLRLNI
jgi:hypothetical protein